MGYADGYYYGLGRIICDTTNLISTDIVRVRSITDPTKVWNKTVTTPGTYLKFDVPSKDIYMICLVQTIDDTPTEVVQIRRAVDYGQVVDMNVLNKTSLAGIQAILNNHMEADLLAVGDEVTITVSGVDVTFVIAHLNAYASHSVIFCKKQATDVFVQNTTSYYRTGGQKDWCQSYYNTIAEKDKQYIKQKTVTAGYSTTGLDITTDNYIWSPTAYEVAGANTTISAESSANNTQFDIFTTAEGRSRNNIWWTATHWDNGTAGLYYAINATGSGIQGSSGLCMLPCFMLTADV